LIAGDQLFALQGSASALNVLIAGQTLVP
jgi:hypothetical protein